MGMPTRKMYLYRNYELETIDVTFFNYTSNPNEKDSDFDNALDIEDATPLVTNDFMNYIFHEKGGDWFLGLEARDRTIKYKKQSRTPTVFSVNTLSDFRDRWNSMGLDSNNKIEYQIDEVVTIFHGGSKQYSYI